MKKNPEIIYEAGQVTGILDSYIPSLSGMTPEQLEEFYYSVKESAKSTWKLQAAIIYEYYSRAEKVGSALKEISRRFGMSRSQVYNDYNVFKNFFAENEDVFEIEEKSWYVTALAAEDPIAAMEWAQEQRDMGNHSLSIRDFKRFIKSLKKDGESKKTNTRLENAMAIDKIGLLSEVNRLLGLYGYKIIIRYGDMEKTLPVSIYVDAVKVKNSKQYQSEKVGDAITSAIEELK